MRCYDGAGAGIGCLPARRSARLHLPTLAEGARPTGFVRKRRWRGLVLAIVPRVDDLCGASDPDAEADQGDPEAGCRVEAEDR